MFLHIFLCTLSNDAAHVLFFLLPSHLQWVVMSQIFVVVVVVIYAISHRSHCKLLSSTGSNDTGVSSLQVLRGIPLHTDDVVAALLVGLHSAFSQIIVVFSWSGSLAVSFPLEGNRFLMQHSHFIAHWHLYCTLKYYGGSIRKCFWRWNIFFQGKFIEFGHVRSGFENYFFVVVEALFFLKENIFRYHVTCDFENDFCGV